MEQVTEAVKAETTENRENRGNRGNSQPAVKWLIIGLIVAADAEPGIRESLARFIKTVRERMRDEFKWHIAQAGMTAILVTHDETEARTMASHGWLLQNGRLSRRW